MAIESFEGRDWLKSVLAWTRQHRPEPLRRDSEADSVAAPSEAKEANPGVPDWVGFTPEIQRLLR